MPFCFSYVDDTFQPRLQPNHWRLLDAPTPAKYGSSIFLSSAMLRNINSNPMPRYRNASESHQNMHEHEPSLHSHQEMASSSSSFPTTTTGDSMLTTKNRRQSQSGGRVKREDISAALSENITMILEDLLKNYDKTERPSFKQGQ